MHFNVKDFVFHYFRSYFWKKKNTLVDIKNKTFLGESLYQIALTCLSWLEVCREPLLYLASDELLPFAPCYPHFSLRADMKRGAETKQAPTPLLLWQEPVTVCVFLRLEDRQAKRGGVVRAISHCWDESLKRWLQVWINKSLREIEMFVSGPWRALASAA